MRKIFLSLIFVFSLCFNSQAASISVDVFTTPDDVTIAHLEQFRQRTVNAINDADGALITDGTITKAELDANTNPENRWDEVFTDFVYTGLTVPTSASLASTTTAGTAYVVGARVVKAATAKTYTASKWTFVDLSNTGVYTYSEASIGGSTPSVAANSIRIARVSTDGTTVKSIVDQRDLSVSFASNVVKVGSFTRDTSLATGTQEVTGVGITPIGVIFLSVQTTSAEMSWGFSNGGSDEVVTDQNTISTDTYSQSSTISIFDVESSSNEYQGNLTSMDTDGFTISWTRNGTPTGTITVHYMAF